MLRDDQLAYYRLRETTERQLAANAQSAGLAKIHTELAETYARIIAGRENTQPST